jgi:hypothetical protein
MIGFPLAGHTKADCAQISFLRPRRLPSFVAGRDLSARGWSAAKTGSRMQNGGNLAIATNSNHLLVGMYHSFGW